MASTMKNNQTVVTGRSEPMSIYPFVITRTAKETYDTFTLDLIPVGRHDGFKFAPGQFNMVYAFGAGEVPISISGDPTDRDRLVHTIRAVGGVTKVMGRMKAGDAVGIRGPFGTGWPVEQAVGCDVVIVAGGIGLAPLRPVVYYLLANREKYNKISLLYGTRTPDDLLYRQQLRKLRGRFDLDLAITVDRAIGDWHGHVGVVTTLIGKAPFDPANSIAMVCGPELMMRFTVMELQKRGIADDKTYISMERNMKCGIGLCGHCQMGPTFICKDGPVYRYDSIKDNFLKREM